MDRNIIIKGKFTIQGIAGMNNVSEPLKYLRLRIAYPPPPIEVQEMKSIGKENKKLNGELKEVKNG